MEIGGNKNFYIIITVVIALISAIIAILYIHARKQQKVFEDAMNEVKEEALKHLRNHAEPPFSEYEDVTNKEQGGTGPESSTETETQQPAQEQVSTPTYTAPVVFTATVTQKEEQVNAEINAPTENQDNTVLNFKNESLLKEYVQAPTNEPLPTKQQAPAKQQTVKTLKPAPAVKPKSQAPVKPKTQAAPKKVEPKIEPQPKTQTQNA